MASLRVPSSFHNRTAHRSIPPASGWGHQRHSQSLGASGSPQDRCRLRFRAIPASPRRVCRSLWRAEPKCTERRATARAHLSFSRCACCCRDRLRRCKSIPLGHRTSQLLRVQTTGVYLAERERAYWRGDCPEGAERPKPPGAWTWGCGSALATSLSAAPPGDRVLTYLCSR
jgi:hypothetical protein